MGGGGGEKRKGGRLTNGDTGCSKVLMQKAFWWTVCSWPQTFNKKNKILLFWIFTQGKYVRIVFLCHFPPPLLREEKEGDLVKSRSCVYVFTFRFVISSKLWFLLVTMRIKFYRKMFCLKSDPIEIESIFGEIKTNSCFGIRLVKAATKVLRLLVACFSSNINYNV